MWGEMLLAVGRDVVGVGRDDVDVRRDDVYSTNLSKQTKQSTIKGTSTMEENWKQERNTNSCFTDKITMYLSDHSKQT